MMGSTPPLSNNKTTLSEPVADERPPATPHPPVAARPPATPHPSTTPPRPAHDGTTSASATERQSLLRLASAGFELASFSLILGGAGYGFDHWLGNTTPSFAIVGVLLGFSLGFYRLIVLASKMS